MDVYHVALGIFELVKLQKHLDIYPESEMF